MSKKLANKKHPNNVLVLVQSIYDSHKVNLDNLKESRSKADEENWTDDEIKSVDSQIAILASILSDLHKKVLQCA